MANKMSIVLFVVATLHAQTANPSCEELAVASIRLIVPNTTGSTYDVYARTMRPALQTTLGTEIYIDNVSGGGGIVAARTVALANPDGSTISIMNGAGILSAALAGRANVPSLMQDFQILGKASPMQHVWAVASNSDIRSVADLRQAAEQSPLVFGVRNIASTSFTSLAVGAHLLNLPHVFVSGYASNRDTRLALMRAELDLTSMDLSSGARQLSQGLLRAVLQISDREFDNPVDVSRIETLADHVRMTSETRGEQARIGRALLGLLGMNRLFVAPAGLSPGLQACMQAGIATALGDATVIAALRYRASNTRFVNAHAVRSELFDVIDSLPLLEPIISAATQRLR